MALFINLILLILQVLVCVKTIKSLKNNFLNFGTLIYLLYFVFSLPIFWDMFLDLGIFKYVYKITAEYNIVTDKWMLTYFNFITFSIYALFYMGYEKIKIKPRKNVEVSANKKRYIIVQVALGALLAVLLIISMSRYDGNILLYFTPSSKSIYGSFYEKYLIMTIPYLLFTTKVFYDNYTEKKLKKSTIFYVILMLLVTSSTGQRREILTAFIYCGLLLLSLKGGNNFNVNKPSKKIVILGVVAVVLISITWYGRSFFGQLQNGVDNIKMPWETRGIVEVIFGSSSTGYPTTVALHNYYKEEGLPYFRQIAYLSQSFIPRAIFKNKLSSITEYVQTQIGADSNLSLFYVNDIYFTFGIFGLGVSYLLGMLFSKIYNQFLNDENKISKSYAFLMLSLIIMFYKNGVVEFIIRFLFMFILMKLCMLFIFKVRKTVTENILVIGNFGVDGKLNGQTARTRTVFNSIKNNYKECSILKIDTSKKNIKSLIQIFVYLIKADVIVIMPAQKSLFYIVKLIKLFNKSDRVIHVVIGGWLYDKIKDQPKIIAELQKYRGILVQVKELQEKLETLSLKNVKLFPNYRLESSTKIKKYDNDKFVFYSRVREDKGILIAIKAIKKVNKITKRNLTLHVYGPIDQDFEESFYETVKKDNCVEYKGVLNGDEIVKTLSGYSALLFPTYYHGEGFPGAVLEAFMAGLPVLASDWKYNSELIENGKNGFIHKVKDVDSLAQDIINLLENENLMKQIRENNIEEAKKYTEKNVFPILKNLI